MIAKMPGLITEPVQGVHVLKFVGWHEEPKPHGHRRCLDFHDAGGTLLRLSDYEYDLDSKPRWAKDFELDPEKLQLGAPYAVKVRYHQGRLHSAHYGSVHVP